MGPGVEILTVSDVRSPGGSPRAALPGELRSGTRIALDGMMMSSVHLFATCLLAGAVFVERPASAQTTTDAPPEDASQHGGPVLRLRVGPAYLSSTIGFGETADRNYSGGGFAFNAEIAGSLTSNVTLGAELSGALSLDASADDARTVYSGGSPTAALSTAGIGPSITYTFHRFNQAKMYVATNPAFTIVRTSAPDHFFLAKDWGSNYFGVGIAFVGGAEWHVSNGWQLGVAAEARYAAVSGIGDISTMSEYALFFSATYD